MIIYIYIYTFIHHRRHKCNKVKLCHTIKIRIENVLFFYSFLIPV